MKFFESLTIWFRKNWESKSFSLGYFFLAVAIWDAFVAAINITVWPRVYDPMILTLTPRSQVLPIVICLTLATFSRVGIRAMLKTYAVISVIALGTFLLWGSQSEAWLNRWGYKLLS